MKLNHISDVFFDLDHTLWDFDRNSALTFHKIFELNRVDVPLKDFIQVYEPINLEYWRLYRNEQIDKPSLRYGRLNDAFTALEMKVERELIDKLAEDYINLLSTFNHLFDDAISILDYLNTNYNLHIITNGFKEVQDGKLAKSGIAKYFDTVTNSEAVGVKKPNPKIFNHALTIANANIEKSIMIGDNLEADVLGALNVGLDAIFFNFRNEVTNNGVKQIKNLIELKNYL